MKRTLSSFQIFLFTILLTAWCHADPPIDSLLWNVTASDNPEKAAQAIDGDPKTRWDTGRSQAVGQWYQVDMGETRPVSEVVLDTTASAGDYPRQYELTVSNDGKTWTPAASGQGATITNIDVSPPVTCRYFRITIPEGATLSGGFWSIHELRASGPEGSLTIPRPPIHWHVVTPQFPTRDVVIAGYDITDFGINPAKGEDATQAINLATRLLARAGGGTLWLPAGHYRISQPLQLTNNVTLRGDWAPPEAGKAIQGTVLEMTANRGDADGPAGISLLGSSAVIDLNFWYPEQDPANIVAYPVTVKQFGGEGMALENITFVNAYRGFGCGPEGAALFFLRNVYGTVLETGIKIDSTSDIGRMEHVRFSPDFWSNSGLPNAPKTGGPHADWMLQNGTGVMMRRNDWSYAYDVQLENYRYGFQSLPSLEPEDIAKNRKNYPNGNNARFKFINCHTAIQCENVSDCGMMFNDTDIIGGDEGILCDTTFTKTLQIQNSRISGAKTAVRLLGPGQILFTHCTITGDMQNPTANLENSTGYIELLGCTNGLPTQPGSAPGVGEIRATPAPATDSIVDPYTTPTDRFAPPSNRLVVVTDSVYGATGDATTDDTAAVKKALSDVTAGGGTVFFPAGIYRITSELVVPSGVELRGVNENPNHAYGSVLDVATGKGDENGKPFITLSAGSGLRGLTFHYPDQDTLNVSPYPFTIQGAGEGVWLINLTAVLAYRIVDLATVKCDHHYVDYVSGMALREGFRIGGGCTGGRLLNCQLNESYYTFTHKYANSPSQLKNGGAVGEATYTYSEANSDAYTLGDCTNETLFQNFVFGTRRGFILTGSSTGPSGWCLGQGEDTCQWDIWAEKIGAAGLPMINNQLVTVDSSGPDRAYIRLDPKFTGNLLCLGVDAWGGTVNAFQVYGGHLAVTSAVIVQSGDATISLKAPGTISFSNAVLRQAAAVLERDRADDNVQLTDLFLTGDPLQFIDSLASLPADLQLQPAPVGCTIGVDFPAASALPTTGWTMTANVNPDAAPLALDGDPATRWTTGRSARPDDQIVVEMDQPQTISKVRVETLASPNDYPRRFELYLSIDGANWGDPVATGKGEADLRVGFKSQAVKYIRLVNMGKSGGYWSIHEFQAAP